MRESDVRGLDPRAFLADCAATNADGVVISAGGIYAFYPSRVRYHHVSPAIERRDFLKEVCSHAGTVGLRIIARVDFSKAREEVFRDHPGWFARRPDGSPARSGVFYSVCPNSPYAAGEFAVPVIREILRGYDIAGFHLNAGGFPGYCYCANCRNRYREHSGAEMPKAPAWESPEWRRYLAWRYDVSAAGFSVLQTAMREERQDVFWTGELAGLDDAGWMRNRAFDIERMSNACSALMSTIDNVAPGRDFRWVSGMTASYARSVGNRPPIINLKAQIRDGGWPRASMPEAEYGLTAWQAIANGAGLKMPVFGVPRRGDDERNMKVIADALGVLKRHAWVYDDALPAAPVALVWSQRTLDLYGRDEPEQRYAGAAHGFYAALVESHIPVTVVGEDSLVRDKLSRYRALVLPNVACMTDEQVRAVADFASQGGGVVGTFETSLFDASGERRPEMALASVFGVRADASAVESAARGSYLAAGRSHEITRFLGSATVLPFAGSYLPVRPAPASEAALVYARHLNAGIPEEIDSPRRTEIPMCIASTPGQGRAVYLPGDVDQFFFRQHLPDARQLLARTVEWVLRGLPIETSAPGGVQITLSRKPGWLFVHFVNAVGRAPLDEVVPLRDIGVSLPLLSRAKTVRSVLGGEKLAFDDRGGRVTIRLPRLHAYEVLAIELPG
jgi:hypothetical protein